MAPEPSNPREPNAGPASIAPGPSVAGQGGGRGEVAQTLRTRRRHRRWVDVPTSYRACDRASGFLILFLVVFTPWAFGTTQPWSLWTADIVGVLLWPLLFAKWMLARRNDYEPPRWGRELDSAPTGTSAATSASPRSDFGILGLAVLTILLLALIVISYFNARADFGAQAGDLVYFEHFLPWLPHSYHRSKTGEWIWHVAGLSGVFWGVRDWLLFRTRKDEREIGREPEEGDAPARVPASGRDLYLPWRLRCLLWVLSLNGMLLVIEGGLQRAAGVADLLFLAKPWRGRGPETVFGPWGYRSNAGQYFNMLWPVCLGFWLCLQERVSRFSHRRFAWLEGAQLVLLPAILCLLAGALVAGSRAAAAVTMGSAAVTTVLVLLASRRDVGAAVRRLAAGSILCALLIGLVLGGEFLARRFLQREQQAATALEVGAQDFSVVVRLKPPAGPVREVINLVALGAFQGNQEWSTRSMHVGLDRSGSLVVELHGAGKHEVGWTVVPDFVAQHGGKETWLVITRGESLRVLVNGREILAKPRPPGAPIQGWRVSLSLQNLAIQNSGVREAALVEGVLTEAESRNVSAGSLKAYFETWSRENASTRVRNAPAGWVPQVCLWSEGKDVFSRERLARLAGRTEIWQNARKIVQDHPVWGTGAGSFGALYELYKRPEQVWAAYVHDDWLETRLTLGWVGFALVVGALAILAGRTIAMIGGRVRVGIPVPGVVILLLGVGLGGCLIHAGYDLPFQVHSVRLLFVCLAGVLASLTPLGGRARLGFVGRS